MVCGPGAENYEHLGRAAEITLPRRGSTSLYSIRMEGTIRRGLGGKKWSRKALLTSSGEVASGRLRNRGVTLPMANLFVLHMVLGMVSSKKDFQCWAFAALIDLKYPCLESFVTTLS